jgi:hypothetical protein
MRMPEIVRHDQDFDHAKTSVDTGPNLIGFRDEAIELLLVPI